MRIKDIRAFCRYQPFKIDYGISSGPTVGEYFVYIKIVGEDGVEGIGEGAPSIPFSAEDYGTALHVIRTYLRPALIGLDSLDLESISATMDRVLPHHSMAKAGIDMALYDLNGKCLEMPVYQLLGGVFREKVPLISAIGISTTERMVREADEAVRQGARTVKMKIGIDPRDDLDRVREVRRVIGPEVRFRVDANQGCNLSDYMTTFRRMEAYDLEFLEQPLPTWDLDGLRRLCAALDTPVLIDEGVYTPHDLMTLIRHEAVDAVNIKIEKTGLSGGKRIAAIAEAAGLPCIVGSMIETGVGTAAGVHFAISAPGVTHACEIGSPAMFFDEDVIEGNPYSTLPPDLCWNVPSGAGLGVTLRKEVDALFETET
ncbi:MAG: hypothetical protein IPK19_17315 [Chloroflexi bacterium]|nr:hypothetical protein [Chloroflexota bacterium]